MMTKDQAWELIKNDERPMDDTIGIIQLDAYKQGMSDAADVVIQYAKQMRGAHLNTNESSATIKNRIIVFRDAKTL